MAIDALLRKYFTLVVLVLIGAVAYLQGSGVAQLASIGLISKDEVSVPLVAATGSSALLRPPRSSAQPLLVRNPFDSVTGELKPKPVVAVITTPQAATVTDPLSAPACEGVQVLIVTESPDPTWSLAALRGPGDTASKLYRVGDSVGDKKVAFIGFNPLRASPSVWFESGASVCQVMMFGAAPPPAAAPTPVAQPGMPAPPPGTSQAPEVPSDIASKIKRISDSEYQVDRSVVDKILENQAELMKSARIVPEQRDGKMVGIRLFGIRPTALLGVLGLQNGDRLEQINGFDMASPEKALEAYARLRTANNLTVKVTRRGQPLNIDYRIK